jgi:hypothetical protein
VITVFLSKAPEGTLRELWRTAKRFPGPHQLTARVGQRVIHVGGGDSGCDGSAVCIAALEEFGPVTLTRDHDPQPPGGS